MRSKTPLLILTGLLTLAGLAACSGGAATPTATPEPPTAVPPTATATPEPRELTICIGSEPQSLYINNGSSRAKWSILESIYDGPIDTVGYVDQPVILTGLPAADNGTMTTQAVAVQRGEPVLSAEGDYTYLDTGVSVRPAGCTDASCAVAWDGTSPLEMDQVTLNYTLLEGLLWSDGQPLTAADSVYAYTVAKDPATPVSTYRSDRTAAYQAADDRTVTWTGIPGFIPASSADFFWLPLPQHAWGQYSAADLLTAEEVNRSPLGWGPYAIREWVPGDHLTLERNSSYFRAAEGLPKFDLLTYRFLGEAPDNNLAALTNGQCDIIDESVDWDGQLMTLTDLQNKGSLKIYSANGPEWEHIDMGINLAAYDGGYSPYADYRAAIFSDIRVRQALAYCTDRQGIIDKLLYGYSQVPAGFFPAGHPLYDGDLSALPYDPEQGAALLTAAGWVDLDGDPSTPRVSQGISNILNDIPLALNFIATDTRLHQMTADLLVESMAACGIQLNVQLTDAGTLFAPGPSGALFGRNFDLAEYAWQSGDSSPCFLYSSNQIPTADNNWIGVNVAGYSDSAYDAACAAALNANPADAPAYRAASDGAQQLFNEQLPSLPLYFSLKIAAAQPQVCNFGLDASARSEFWNIEALDISADCAQ